MAQTPLAAHTGRTTGSAPSRRLRREDQIPAVVYGQGMTPISIHVDRRDLRQAVSGSAGMNTVLDLRVDGTSYPAIIKEIQRHPVRRTISHIDFLQVNLNEEITVSIPVRLEGEAKAVLSAGGIVDPAVDTLDVVTTPNSIPDEILIDVSGMDVGDVIRVADITLPAGVSTLADPEMALVSTLVSRSAAAAREDSEDGESTEAAASDDSAGDDASE
jgi:large subunit ribosomal protein L25